ncbi:30S ribosomal protein S1 [Candidatus Dojkabacteria bacterium]|uniref:30S ribosomal protein S1 n=1 Tax=Candidatus Dojkabacteria bacterium TaxID=2099670 RepID=A0A955L3I4_9BACT|nr:30S ribosomal protein S1 [Candidatus Dojkabacteria bacterium]
MNKNSDGANNVPVVNSVLLEDIAPDETYENDIHEKLDEYLSGVDFTPMSYEKGQIISGKVVKVRKGEILVDVQGKAEGIIAGRETKSDDDEDVKIGDDVLVYVVNPENDRGQMELSIRRTGEAKKWHKLFSAQKDSEMLEVEVIEANTGGVLVNVGSGLRGFIPTSQIDAERIHAAEKELQADESSQSKNVSIEMQKRLAKLIGQNIKVKIVEIDRDKNRIILSEKLVTNAQDMEKKEETLRQMKIGDDLEAVVTGVTPYGLFVNAQGLDGLVHLSEISWDKVDNPGDYYKVGDKVKVKVIGIDDGGKRVAYSIKRLQPDPWAEAISAYKVGQIVKGKVQKIVDYGVFVRISEGLNGLIHISELSDQLVEDPNEIVKLDDELDLQILSISPTERHLGLSLKRVKSGN